MDDSSELKLKTFEQNHILSILYPVLYILFIFTFFRDLIFKDIFLLAFFGSHALFLLVLCIVNLSTVYINDVELEVVKIFSTKKIILSEIISMAVVNILGLNMYQIKTHKGTFTFPTVIEYKEFQELVMKYANLESVEKTWVPIVKIQAPEYERWRKIGQKYELTSVFDWLNSLSYKFNSY